MLERYEIRLLPRYRYLLDDTLPVDEKSRSGPLVLRGTVNDELFMRIAELDMSLRKSGQITPIAGWDIKRTYSEEEVDDAKLFYLKIPYTHLAAEEYGTEYDEATDCQQETTSLESLGGGEFRTIPEVVPCGICSRQVTILRVPFRKLSRKLDIFRIWGGELLISERFSNLIKENYSGATLVPVFDESGKGSLFDPFASVAGSTLSSVAAARNLRPNDLNFWQWLYNDAPKSQFAEAVGDPRLRVDDGEGKPSERRIDQLLVQSEPVRVASQSRFGDNPFDVASGGHFRCKSGEIAGRRPISSLSILGETWNGSDLCRSNIYVSARQGLFRPHQLLFVSRRLLTAMRRFEMKGFEFETVDLL